MLNKANNVTNKGYFVSVSAKWQFNMHKIGMRVGSIFSVLWALADKLIEHA